MSVMRRKIGEYMNRRTILMNQKTSSYFKYIFILNLLLCVIMNKQNKVVKEISLI